MDEVEPSGIVKERYLDPFSELDLAIDLRTALGKLSGYDLLLLWSVFDAQMRFEQVAEILGVSRQSVQKAVDRIISRLRRELTS